MSVSGEGSEQIENRRCPGLGMRERTGVGHFPCRGFLQVCDTLLESEIDMVCSHTLFILAKNLGLD